MPRGLVIGAWSELVQEPGSRELDAFTESPQLPRGIGEVGLTILISSPPQSLH